MYVPGSTSGLRCVFITSTPSSAPELTREEQEWVNILNKQDANAILNSAENKQKVNKFGQLIFDTFFRQSGGDSRAAFESCQRICEALAFTGDRDARIRKSHVEAAWRDIGDENVRWEP